MRVRTLFDLCVIVATAAGAGCSFIYDPDQIAGPTDAALAIDGGSTRIVAATEIVEGFGCLTAGCDTGCTAAGCPDDNRAGLVIVETPPGITIQSVVATIEIPTTQVSAVIEEIGHSADQRQTTFAVRIPVTNDLEEDVYTLAILAELSDGNSATLAVPVQGLANILFLNGSPTTLRPRYATITIPAGITPQFEDAAVRLIATSDIFVSGTLSVSATESAPGPGGCRGASSSATVRGGCGLGGGSSDTGGSPGGGGSFGTAGAGARAGVITGSPLLIPFGSDGNAGNGGGASAFNAGGHGGGAVLVITPGRLSITGAINANGGDPAPAMTLPSGGGGSGGAILLRAGRGLDISGGGGSGTIVAHGGGESAVQGGDGRIRIDTPGLVNATTAIAPVPVAGPIAVGPPLILQPNALISFRGTPGMSMSVVIDGVAANSVTLDATGIVRASVVTAPGLHTICAKGASVADCNAIENCACFDVVTVQ